MPIPPPALRSRRPDLHTPLPPRHSKRASRPRTVHPTAATTSCAASRLHGDRQISHDWQTGRDYRGTGNLAGIPPSVATLARGPPQRDRQSVGGKPAIVHGAGIGSAASDSPARPRSFAEPADRILTSTHAPPCRPGPAPVVATFIPSNRLRPAARRTNGRRLPRAPDRRRRSVPGSHRRRRSRRLDGADGCPCFGAGSPDSVPLGSRSARASRPA